MTSRGDNPCRRPVIHQWLHLIGDALHLNCAKADEDEKPRFVAPRVQKIKASVVSSTLARLLSDNILKMNRAWRGHPGISHRILLSEFKPNRSHILRKPKRCEILLAPDQARDVGDDISVKIN